MKPFGLSSSALALVVLLGCGRTLLDPGSLDDTSDTGGASSATRGGASGTGAGTAPLGGSGASGGSLSGLGGTSMAGIGGSGSTSCDADGDNWRSVECGGPDCDDQDPTIPGDDDSNATVSDWSRATIAELRGPSDVAVEPNGTVHVAFGANGLVRHLVQTSASEWHTDWSLLGDVDYMSSLRLAVDSRGHARIAFGGSGAPLVVARQRDHDWTVSQLDPVAEPMSLVVDPGDVTHIAYLFTDIEGTTRLRYADTDTGDFEVEDVYFGVRAASLAIEPGWGARVALVRADTNSVYYGIRSGPGSWRFEKIPISPSAELELGPGALAIDGAGIARLAFSLDGVLMVAERHASWEIESVPALPDVFSPFLRVDARGTGHLVVGHPGQAVTHREGGRDGWTDEEEVPSNGFLNGVFLEPSGVLHLALQSGLGTGREWITYTTNRHVDRDDVDRDCDGTDGVDADDDGEPSTATGGDDCNDRDAAIHVGASDSAGDGIDSDCDGQGACPIGLPGPPLFDVEAAGGPFCIDSGEVTNREYSDFLSAGSALPPGPPGGPYFCSFNSNAEPAVEGTIFGSSEPCPAFDPEGAADSPVVCIDWCDAWSYCAWAGKHLCRDQNGGAITDPARSEWMIACNDPLFSLLRFAGGVREWQDGCVSGTSPRLDACPVYGGSSSDEPAEQLCSTTATLPRGEAAWNVGFRCCTD